MFLEGDEDLSGLPREELIERARALQTVLRVAQAVTSARDVKDLATRFCEAVRAYTRFPSVVVLRFNPAAQTFELLAQGGFDVSRFPSPNSTLPAKGSLTGLAAERGEVLTTDDLANDERVEPATRAALKATGYVSGASIPVIHGGEVLGSYNLVYPGGSVLQPIERRMLDTLGKTLAVAMAQLVAVERERELEKQAQRAQQLESLGLLAGGIAHDFNNLLTGLVGSVDLARVGAQEAGLVDTVATLEQALAAADRATSLVRQLLTFSRGHEPSRRLVNDLDRVIRESASFAARGTSVRCDVDIASPLGPIDVDVGQIGQVVQNLVINACQASPSGSTVVVRAERHEAADGSPWVRISVIDRGTGIADEHLPRIFEPFYTARPGGTGLGLSVSHSIVQRHGGRLTASSVVDRGSTFTVDLPASTAPVDKVEPHAPAPVLFDGRALVMDDEPAVRRIASLMLKHLGFEVEQAEHGARALDLAAQAVAQGRPFRVAVLDLTVVGGLGAAEIAADLRQVSPGTRLILSTGYAHSRVGEGWDGMLGKPYDLVALREAIARALASRRPE